MTCQPFSQFLRLPYSIWQFEQCLTSFRLHQAERHGQDSVHPSVNTNLRHYLGIHSKTEHAERLPRVLQMFWQYSNCFCPNITQIGRQYLYSRETIQVFQILSWLAEIDFQSALFWTECPKHTETSRSEPPFFTCWCKERIKWCVCASSQHLLLQRRVIIDERKKRE